MTVTEPVEFVLIGPHSDHGYEALARTEVMPGAVFEALKFIGLATGRAPDPAALVFWPKGERTLVFVRTPETNLLSEPVPVELLFQNTGTTQALARTGFILLEPGRGLPAGAPLPADKVQPGAIVALYNEPTTILDVPRIAVKGSVYGTQRLNAQRPIPPDTLLEFSFRAERPAGPPRVRELTLTVLPPLAAPAEPRYLMAEAGATNVVARDAAGMEALVHSMAAAGLDPFVHVRLDPALTVAQANRACGVLAGLENEAGLRVEPPDPDQLFYRGFLPDEGNRRRSDRIQQPWELRLTNAASATLTRIEERWHDDELKPELIVTDHPLSAPADLRAALERLGPGMPVILVFAAPQVTVGSVMRWVRDVRHTHGFIHVYIEG